MKWHKCQIFAASRMQQLRKNAKEIAANQSNEKALEIFRNIAEKCTTNGQHKRSTKSSQYSLKWDSKWHKKLKQFKQLFEISLGKVSAA